MSTKVIAHRGNSSQAPENTKAAFLSGLDAGAQGTELDVHLTRDGIPVVIHDPTLDRTTNGQGAIADLQWRELAHLDAGAWFGPEFEGQRIMRLSEALMLLDHKDHLINVELKSGKQIDPEYETAVLREVIGCDMLDKVLFSSFDHYLINRLVRVEPRAKAGILFYSLLYRPWEYAKMVGATSLHPYWQAVHPVWVKRAQEIGIDIHVYTVDDPQVAKGLAQLGVTSVITNKPKLILDHLGKVE